jgi:hypothetical protein
MGWAGGVNMRDAANQIQPNEARRMENGILDERGGWSKRLGCSSLGTVGTGADRIISGWVFYRGATAPQVLVQTTAGKVYYTNDPTANPITWVLIASGYSTTQPISWQTFNSKVYFCEGAASYSSWDGTTLATYGAVPKFRYLKVSKDTMWGSGVDSLPDRVFQSTPGDAETWPIASWVDIRHGDGDQVKAIGEDIQFVIVFKRDTATVIYDPALFSNRLADPEKGAESHFSLVQHEESLFYFSRRGICEWQGDTPAKLISYKLDPLFDPDILNWSALSKVWGFSWENRVSWAIPEKGSPDTTVQVHYYPRLAEISAFGVRGLGPFSFDRVPGRCFVRYRSGTVERLFAGANGANKFYWVYADSAGTDDGAGFQSVLETQAYDFSQPLHEKYLRRLRVLGRGKFTVQFIKNFQGAASKSVGLDLSTSQDLWDKDNNLWGVGSWSSPADLQEVTVNPDVYARYVSLVFVDAETINRSKTVFVGSTSYTVPAGEWSVVGVILDGYLLGVRS